MIAKVLFGGILFEKREHHLSRAREMFKKEKLGYSK